MTIIKGFLTNASLVSNVDNVVAQFGELSDISNTFSRRKAFYQSTVSAEQGLVVFSAKDGITHVTTTSNDRANIFALSDYVYDRYNASTITATAGDLITDIETDLTAGTVTISNVAIGEIISDVVTPTKRLPDYVSFHIVDTLDSSEHDITVWFCDANFQSQYDEYEILVVSPLLGNVDDLYASNSDVGVSLAAVTLPAYQAAIETAKGVYPPTKVKAVNFTWNEHSDFGSNTRTMAWTLVFYGNEGDSPANIRTALRDWLEDVGNTAIAAADWQEMFPEIFESTDYYIIPLWNRVHTPVPTVLYSPMGNPTAALATAKANVPFTALDAFWNPNLTLTTATWQQLMFLAIGAPTNTTNNDFNFAIKFNDYMNVPLTHIDAAHMSAETQAFVAFLTQLLQGAETLTVSTPLNQLPQDMDRVQKSGKLYLTGLYDGTQYYAIAKGSYLIS